MRSYTCQIKLVAVSIALLLWVPFTTALAAPTLSVDTSPWNFSPPSFMVGAGSPEFLRLIGNSGSDPLTFSSGITGANPDDFILSLCVQATLDPHANWCKVQIAFRPTATGTRTAILEMKTNDPVAGKVQIQLNGMATVAAPRVTAVPSPLVMGTQPVGVASPAQHITISNSGVIPLTITNITTDNSEFSVVTGCITPTPISPGGRCAADVTFTPSAGGPRQAVLTVDSDDPRGPFTVPITGTGGVPTVSVAPTSINFGTSEVGSSIGPRQVVLTNTGTAALSVTAASFSGVNAADFTVKSGLPCTAPSAGDNCIITLGFFANAFGSRTGQVSFTTNALGSQPSVALSGFGDISAVSPPPLSEDDLHFVGKVERAGTTCKSNGQRLSVTASVSRVIGSLGPSAAVAGGTLLPSATLEIMALDSSATALHAISVNGTTVANLPTAPGSWTLRTVTLPVTLLNFPAQAPIGSDPTPSINTIEIDPDTTMVGGCVNVAWVRLSFKAMSPVILIHGNNSDGGFFVRQGFAGALTAAGIGNDSSINLAGLPGSAATIATNASTLQCLVPPVVRSFGVNSVHIVAHSKGGLDTRLWLSLFASTNLTARPPVSCARPGTVNPAFRVISLTTLSTPHLGSALADLSIATDATGVALFGFSLGTLRSLGLSATDMAIPNLTTFFTSVFNPPLPTAADYRMLGGDTDLNGDGSIVNVPVDEYLAARSEPPPPPPSTLAGIFAIPPTTFGGFTITGPQLANGLATLIHGILSNVSRFTVGSTTVVIPLPFIPFPVVVTITHPVPVLTTAPAPNDLLVTIGSANGGPAPFVSAVAPLTFTLAAGRDHASIANAGVAAFVIPLLITTDLVRGDLK